MRGIYEVSVAVNVSALQLMEDSFISHIVNLSKEKQIPLTQLEVELTESVFAQDLQFIAPNWKSSEPSVFWLPSMTLEPDTHH
jgi:EAL domain-containing protein (putative c-di-GMP-specific phosphodiesterase class I)